MTHICDPDEGYCRVTREKVVRVGLHEWVCGYEPPSPFDDRPQHADNGVEPSSDDDSHTQQYWARRENWKEQEMKGEPMNPHT